MHVGKALPVLLSVASLLRVDWALAKFLDKRIPPLRVTPNRVTNPNLLRDIGSLHPVTSYSPQYHSMTDSTGLHTCWPLHLFAGGKAICVGVEHVEARVGAIIYVVRAIELDDRGVWFPRRGSFDRHILGTEDLALTTGVVYKRRLPPGEVICGDRHNHTECRRC